MAFQSAQPGQGDGVGGQSLLVGDGPRGVTGRQGCGLDGRVAGRCGGRCPRALAGVDALGQKHGRHRVRALLGQQTAQLGYVLLQSAGLPSGLPGQLCGRPAFRCEQKRLAHHLGRDRIAQPTQQQAENESADSYC